MRCFALIVAVVLFVPAGVFADSTITINANADSLVLNATPTTNYGTWTWVGTRHQNSDVALSYLAFATNGTLPGGATVVSAKLWLYDFSNNVGGALGTATDAVYRANDTPAWTQTGLTWNTRPGTSGGALSSNSFSSNTGAGWVSWDVTGGWASQPKLTFMLADTSGYSGSGNKYTEFYSEEQGQAYAPYLQVTYDLPSGATPELPANALLSLSMIPMGLVWLRRRGKR